MGCRYASGAGSQQGEADARCSGFVVGGVMLPVLRRSAFGDWVG
jgi:hypothetical protein